MDKHSINSLFTRQIIALVIGLGLVVWVASFLFGLGRVVMEPPLFEDCVENTVGLDPSTARGAKVSIDTLKKDADAPSLIYKCVIEAK